MDGMLWVVVLILVLLCIGLLHRLKKTQQQLQQSEDQAISLSAAQRKAEHASEAKSRFLSGISHELRTPLNVIMGHAQLLEQAHPDNPTFAVIRQNGEHLNHLIESLLSHAAMEAGKVKMHPEIFDLHELLEQLCHMFEPMASDKGLSWSHVVSKHTPQWVKTDRQRLKQVLINLISNAIKFTSNGSITFDISYRSQVAVFKVIDTGVGIKEKHLEDIFKPFERLQGHVPGSGLGLPISQSLATLMGGELSVTSHWQQGSEFTLKLMLAPQAAPKTADPTEVREHVRVLVVDDNPAHLDIARAFLQQDGHQVDTANDHQAALKQINQFQYDLCLLDINMPEVDGWSLAQSIRDEGHAVPIVMLSGNPKEHIKSTHQNHQDYLTKPLQLSALRACIGKLVPPQKQLPEKQMVKLTASQHATLSRMAAIGHINGIEKQLQEWQQAQTIDPNSYHQLMKATHSFQMEQIKSLLAHAHH